VVINTSLILQITEVVDYIWSLQILYNKNMQDSVFTKIIKGNVPCHKIYEDALTVAFLDINPVAPGMTLVVSKQQVDNIEDLSTDDYRALWDTVQKVAKRLRHVFPDYKKICIQVEGLDVPHAHAKLFPINTGADSRALPDAKKPTDHAALAVIAAKLAF